MPPLDNKVMSETVKEMRDLLSSMKVLHESTKTHGESQRERQEIWEKLINEQTNNNKERLTQIDKRWNNLMRIVIVLAGMFFVSFVNNTMSLRNRPTKQGVADMMKEEDAASRKDVIGGINSTINSVYDTFERQTDMTHDEAREDKTEAKLEADKEITGYKARSIKK